MQVSYGKLKVNDGRKMGARRLPLPRDDGEQDAVTWLYTVENCVFQRLEKFFTLYFLTRV